MSLSNAAKAGSGSAAAFKLVNAQHRLKSAYQDHAYSNQRLDGDSKRFATVQQDGNRAIVHKCHLHVCLEDPLLYPQARIA